MFKRKGGGVKGLLNNVKKNCTFLSGWLPLFGQCPKENVFFIDVFPISETYVGAQREVPRSEGAPVLTVEVTLWVTQNL